MSEHNAQERSRKRHGAYSPRLDKPAGSFHRVGHHCSRWHYRRRGIASIITDLQLNLTQAQWVNSLYAVLLAALLLSTGKIADTWVPSSPA
ncbi:hypothetical protein ABRP64_04535 [Corynebacterium sp. KPL4015]|uniref:hypothetical protein n=1 Tax=Corynebacterium sp. KPL4015 TaxID=3158326 RepID=UPI0032EEB38B